MKAHSTRHKGTIGLVEEILDHETAGPSSLTVGHRKSGRKQLRPVRVVVCFKMRLL